MFITWQKTVGVRLKSDLRFSTLTWNTFPVSALDEQARQRIIDAGQLVLQAREQRPERSLAEHYAEDTAGSATAPPERRRATVSEEVANFVFNDMDMRTLRAGYWDGLASEEVLSVWGYLPMAPIMKTNVIVTRNANPIAMIQFSGSDKSVRSRKMFIEISAVTMPITEVMGTSLVMGALPCLVLEESWADACFPVFRLHVEM